MTTLLTAWKRSRQIVGINERNLIYVYRYNPDSKIRLANNKLQTKKVLARHGLPVPKTYLVVKTVRDLAKISWEDIPNSFVVKPNKGLGGRGVKIFYARQKNSPAWIGAGGKRTSFEALRVHIKRITSGDYSMNGLPDTALLEERIAIDRDIKPYTTKGGVPDVRVIVFEKIPVMAMLRLPTSESGGRANLALGAIGVGLDLASGVSTSAIQHGDLIDCAPKTRLVLKNIQISHWSSILRLASEASGCVGLGFVGVDIAIDKARGPVVLEVNARPGLKIQTANLAPLGERLRRVKGLKIDSAKKAVLLGQELFGASAERYEAYRDVLTRPVIGIFEPIKLLGRNGQEKTLVAKIDTGAFRTSIAKELAQELGIDQPVVGRIKTRSALGSEERPVVQARFKLGGRVIETTVSLTDRTYLKTGVIIGRRDLGGFVIDPVVKKRI